MIEIFNLLHVFVSIKVPNIPNPAQTLRGALYQLLRLLGHKIMGYSQRISVIPSSNEGTTKRLWQITLTKEQHKCSRNQISGLAHVFVQISYVKVWH